MAFNVWISTEQDFARGRRDFYMYSKGYFVLLWGVASLGESPHT